MRRLIVTRKVWGILRMYHDCLAIRSQSHAKYGTSFRPDQARHIRLSGYHPTIEMRFLWIDISSAIWLRLSIVRKSYNKIVCLMGTKSKKYVFPRYEVEQFVSKISRRSSALGVLKFEIFKGASNLTYPT